MPIKSCRRCGLGLHLSSRKRKRAFCSEECYEAWWADRKSSGESRSQVAEKIIGTPSPEFALTDVQAAWLAALIDGEGCIGIWKERRPGNASGLRYKAAVEVMNTNAQILYAAAAIVDGNVYLKEKRKNPIHKPLYRMRMTQRAVKSLLLNVRPYLVIKQRQADVVIEFCRTMEDAPVRASQEHPRLEVFYQACKALNKRGR